MRGKKAKTLRGYVGYKPGTTVTYGQQEVVREVGRLTRQPGPFGTFKMVMKKSLQRTETGARVCTGPRGLYRSMKAAAKGKR